MSSGGELLSSLASRLPPSAQVSPRTRAGLALLGLLALSWLVAALVGPGGPPGPLAPAAGAPAAGFGGGLGGGLGGGGLLGLGRARARSSLAMLGAELCGAGGGASAGGASAGGVVGSAPLAPTPRPHIASAFASIYATLRWGADGEGSGAGSTLRATAGTRALVEMLVWRHRVTRLLDAPCGSAHWWPPLLARLRAAIPCFTYRGLDVVPSVVAANAARHADAAPAVSFAVADLSAAGAPLPVGGADMILCRDALQHIPLLDAIDVLENFARSAPRLLAVGSYLLERGDGGKGERPARADANRNIEVGEYFPINLLALPFNMTDVLDILDEGTPVKDAGERKFLLVYAGDALAAMDFDAMRERAVNDFGARRAATAAAARRAQ